MIPNWGSWVLVVQLLLIFFTPPIQWGNRNLFLSDLWCFAWVGAAILDLLKKRNNAPDPEWSRVVRFLGYTGLFMAAVYLHGTTRPTLVRDIFRGIHYVHNNYMQLSETDLFQPGRELVVMLRFLSWIWAGRLVAYWFSFDESSSKNVFQRISFWLSISLLISGGIMLVEKLSPEFHHLLGGIYLFDSKFVFWETRMYGTFRSPVEAANALCFGALCLLALTTKQQNTQSISLNFALKVCALVFAIAGVILTKTLMPVLTLLILVMLWVVTRFRGKKRYRVIAGFFAACTLLALLVGREFFSAKLGDFSTRIGPWKFIAGTTAASSWHHFLLGFGFAPYHTDSSYVFVFNRTGFIGLLILILLLKTLYQRFWNVWTPIEKSLLLFLLIGGTLFDLWIYRHVATLLIVAAIPILVKNRTFLGSSS